MLQEVLILFLHTSNSPQRQFERLPYVISLKHIWIEFMFISAKRTCVGIWMKLWNTFSDTCEFSFLFFISSFSMDTEFIAKAIGQDSAVAWEIILG